MNLAIGLYLREAIPLAKELGDLRFAGEMYKIVLSNRPDNAQAQLGLARVLADMGQSLLAIERYETYINPHNNFDGHQDSLAHLELARLYRGRREIRQALVTLQKARSLNPENPDILIELATVYLESNNRDQAIELAEAATVKAPDNPDCRNLYAQILLRLSQAPAVGAGRMERAREHLNKADQQSQEAVRLAQEVLRLSPDDPESLTGLQGCYGTRVQVLTEQLRFTPDQANLPVRIDLAGVIQERANIARRLRLHDALAVLTAVADRGDRNADYLQLRAELELLVHKTQAAADTCRKLLELRPDSQTVKRLIEQLPADLRPSLEDPPATAPNTEP